MNYKQFATEYDRLMRRLLECSPDNPDSHKYAQQLSDLVEAYPDYELIYESELDFEVALA